MPTAQKKQKKPKKKYKKRTAEEKLQDLLKPKKKPGRKLDYEQPEFEDAFFAAEEFDLLFTKAEVETAISAYNDGITFLNLLATMQKFKSTRTGDEILVLLLDLGSRGKLKPRDSLILADIIRGI